MHNCGIPTASQIARTIGETGTKVQNSTIKIQRRYKGQIPRRETTERPE
jgi:hypothetical protein